MKFFNVKLKQGKQCPCSLTLWRVRIMFIPPQLS